MFKNYSVITGYWNGDNSWKKEDATYKKQFFKVWYANTLKYSEPKDIFVINSGSQYLPDNKLGKWIDLSFNLGHVHDLDTNNYQNKKFCGWSMSFIIGAFCCYANNTDMIYKEQDCLAFNGWVDKIYKTATERNVPILVGSPNHSDNQGLEQSLFYIKHNFLMEFVNLYLNIKFNDAGVNYLRPELKFKTILNSLGLLPKCNLPFGYGRSRPNLIDSNEDFYLQKINEQELNNLHILNLL